MYTVDDVDQPCLFSHSRCGHDNYTVGNVSSQMSSSTALLAPSQLMHALDDHHEGQGHFNSALPHVPDTVTTWYPQSMRQFSGLYLLSQN